MKQSLWLLCVAKKLGLIWCRRITPLSRLNQAAAYRGNCGNWKLKENQSWVKSVFVIRAAPLAEKLRRWLEYCGSWKNTLWKLAVRVNAAAQSIRVLNERNVSDSGNLCPLLLESNLYPVYLFLALLWDLDLARVLVWSANQEKGLEVKLSTTNSDYPGGVDVIFVAIEDWKNIWFCVLQRHEIDLNVLCF